MQQVTTLVFYINSTDTSSIKKLFDIEEFVSHTPLKREFATIINTDNERFDMCTKGIIDDEETYSKEYFKNIFAYCKSKNYRVMFYDNYEALNLDGLVAPVQPYLTIEDIVDSAKQEDYDLTQIYFYDCGDKTHYKKQHHLKKINFIKWNNVIRHHSIFKCASAEILENHNQIFPTLIPEYKTKWFCGFTNKPKFHRVLFECAMNEHEEWRYQNISFNNIKDEVALPPDLEHYLDYLPLDKKTAKHEPIFDHYLHSFYTPPSVKTFQESAICVVGESEFEGNNIFITEKSSNPIINCMPTLSYGQKNTMHTLEEHGIDILRDLFGDFSWDTHESSDVRVLKTAEVCKTLLDKDIKYYQDWLKDNKDRLIQNALLIFKQVSEMGDEFGKYNKQFLKGLEPGRTHYL